MTLPLQQDLPNLCIEMSRPLNRRRHAVARAKGNQMRQLNGTVFWCNQYRHIACARRGLQLNRWTRMNFSRKGKSVRMIGQSLGHFCFLQLYFFNYKSADTAFLNVMFKHPEKAHSFSRWPNLKSMRSSPKANTVKAASLPLLIRGAKTTLALR